MISQRFAATRSIALAAFCAACSGQAPATPPVDAPADATPTLPDAPPVAGVPFVFVASGNGTIRTFSIDLAAATLGTPTTTTAGAVPAFLALSPNGHHLFAIDANKNTVLSFTVDRQTGALTKLDEHATGGNGPAHVSVDQTGKWVFIAHYESGTYAVVGVGSDGRFTATADSAAVGARAHYIAADRTNKHVVIPCLQVDYVAVRELDAATGTLTPATPPTVALPAGAGPRHLAFSPDEKFAYVNGETNSTVSTLTFNETTGAMARIETVTTLPAGFSGANTTAEVLVHPNGSFVYVSNRGHNSIARFRRDLTTGKLTPLGHTSTRGDTPRSVAIDSTGRVLIAANQNSGSIAVFTINTQTGDLSAVGDVINVPAPGYVGILDIK